MVINKERFIGKYLQELEETINSLESHLLNLQKDHQNSDELTALLRDLHTIKGSSRMLQFLTMEQLAHGLEDLFRGIRDGRYTVTSSLVQLCFMGIDALRFGAQPARLPIAARLQSERRGHERVCRSSRC